MRNGFLSAAFLATMVGPALAQSTRAALPTSSDSGPPTTAATVNGQPISEAAVTRALKNIPSSKQAEVRTEVINFLIDNALIDQFLAQQNIKVDPKEVDAKINQFREAVKKQGNTYEKALQELMLSEVELRAQVLSQLRWERYVNEQATEAALRDLFEHHRDMFDGSMVRARHILVSFPPGDAKAAREAKSRLEGIRTGLLATIDRGLAQLPATTDSAGRERARAKLVEESFGEAARKESACPSREQGGDLGYFPRSGSMVEPFARAAFALTPFQISEVVTTQFGHHLIVVTDRRGGAAPKYEDAKEDVKDVFGDHLRDGLLGRLRPSAIVTLAPVK